MKKEGGLQDARRSARMTSVHKITKCQKKNVAGMFGMRAIPIMY